jgi:hypothetical protein
LGQRNAGLRRQQIWAKIEMVFDSAYGPGVGIDGLVGFALQLE